MTDDSVPHGPIRLGPMRRFTKAMIFISKKMIRNADRDRDEQDDGGGGEEAEDADVRLPERVQRSLDEPRQQAADPQRDERDVDRHEDDEQRHEELAQRGSGGSRGG